MLDTSVLGEVYRYWFGDLDVPPEAMAEKWKRWFQATPEIDAEIRAAFGHYLDPARANPWDVFALTHDEQAGLIILLDQFPRQIFRDSAEAFAYDAKAREVANALIVGGLTRFHTVERSFILLPLEHSEDIADQDRSVALYAAEAVTAAPEAKEPPRNTLDFATKHRDIIRKFGRFPHRNALLGRASTPEEIEFLKGGRGY
jgi:uncharacterized protein (DUF924 family)